MPHVIASTLAATTDERVRPLIGAGWRDTTRVAAGSVELWVEILRTNRDEVLRALTGFDTVLAHWRQALENSDWAAAATLLREGKQLRDTLGN
jgi:prephenate dehydrogenase